MSTQEAIEFWDPSGLLQGTPDDKKGVLTNLLNQTKEYMENNAFNEKVELLILPMITRLFNSGKEIEDHEKVIDKFVAEFSIEAYNMYNNAYSFLDAEVEFVASFVENFKP